MDMDAHYQLAPGVAIRPERFGGLIYRHDTRRLYFLHSPELVDFVGELDGSRPLNEALDTFLAGRDMPAEQREPFLTALGHLEQMEVLTRAEIRSSPFDKP